MRSYDGGDIQLNPEQGIVLSPAVFPELADYLGQDLVVTDGTTLLGADDKAGVAEIMDMAASFLLNPERPHGEIRIAFTLFCTTRWPGVRLFPLRRVCQRKRILPTPPFGRTWPERGTGRNGPVLRPG